MLETTLEKARDLGRFIGQSDEYKALRRARERVGAVLQEPGARERQIERRVACGDGAGRRMADLLADLEILEEVAGGRLAHLAPCRVDAALRLR